MSNIVTKLVWSAEIHPAPRKLVMVYLADRCDDNGGKLFPAMQTIADACGMSRSQAQRHMHALQHAGLVDVIENATGGRPGKTPNYRINLARLTGRMDAQEGSHGCTGRVAPVHKTGRTDAQEGSHGCDPIHHRTTIDPPINPAVTDSESDLQSKTAEVIRRVQAAGIDLPAHCVNEIPELISKGATSEQFSHAINEAKRGAKTNPGGYMVKVVRTELAKAGGTAAPARPDKFASRPAGKMSEAEAHEWADHLGIARWDRGVQIGHFVKKLGERYDAIRATQDCAVA